MPTTMPPEGGRGLARAVSLLLAVAVAGVLFAYPRILGAGIESWRHGVLALTLLGASAGFAHGVGFVPESRVPRVLLGPWYAWPAMAGGAAILLFSR